MPSPHVQPTRPETSLYPHVVRERLNAHYKPVHRFAYKLTRNANDADDLTQDVMVKAMRYADSGQLYCDTMLKSWLLKTTYTTFIDLCRRSRRRVEVGGFDCEWDERLTHTAPVDDPTLRRDMTRLLENLPEEDRKMLLAVYVEGALYREYSAQTGLPLGTVMRRLHNARARARQLMAEAA